MRKRAVDMNQSLQALMHPATLIHPSTLPHSARLLLLRTAQTQLTHNRRVPRKSRKLNFTHCTDSTNQLQNWLTGPICPQHEPGRRVPMDLRKTIPAHSYVYRAQGAFSKRAAAPAVSEQSGPYPLAAPPFQHTHRHLNGYGE